MSEFRWPTVDEVLKIIDEENNTKFKQKVKAILDEMDIEHKTMTSLVHPPLAVWYGLNDPRDILEFARRLNATQPCKSDHET